MMWLLCTFLLTLCLTTMVIGQYDREICRSPDEYCVPLEMCPAQIRLIKQGYRPQACAFQGTDSSVCCHIDNTDTNNPQSQNYEEDQTYSQNQNRRPQSTNSQSNRRLYTSPTVPNNPYINTNRRRQQNDQDDYGSFSFTPPTRNRYVTEKTTKYRGVYDQYTTKPTPRQNSHKYQVLDSNLVITPAPVQQANFFSGDANANLRPNLNQQDNFGYNNGQRVSKPVEPSPSKHIFGKPQTSNLWQNEVTSRPSAKPRWTQSTQGPLSKRDQADGTYMRISEQKCREYSSHVTEDFAAIPLLLDPEPLYFSVAKCKYDSVPLIVGGEKAELDEFPHMAAIGYARRVGGYAFSCGGSLISENFVLTAAHCTSNDKDNTLSSPHPKIIRLGDLNLVSDDDGAEPIEVHITQIIKHPDYKPPKKYHDIALLKFAEQFPFSLQIRPACLWTKPNLESTHAVATGWGQIDFAEETSDDLLKVVLDIIDPAECRKMYAHSLRRRLPLGITGDQLCAGSKKGGRDTCGGDSGGPLQVPVIDNQCIFNIIGVTSIGKSACGKANGPGIYTAVALHVDWIERVVWNATTKKSTPEGSDPSGSCEAGFCVHKNECVAALSFQGCKEIGENYLCCTSKRLFSNETTEGNTEPNTTFTSNSNDSGNEETNETDQQSDPKIEIPELLEQEVINGTDIAIEKNETSIIDNIHSSSINGKEISVIITSGNINNTGSNDAEESIDEQTFDYETEMNDDKSLSSGDTKPNSNDDKIESTNKTLQVDNKNQESNNKPDVISHKTSNNKTETKLKSGVNSMKLSILLRLIIYCLNAILVIFNSDS